MGICNSTTNKNHQNRYSTSHSTREPVDHAAAKTFKKTVNPNSIIKFQKNQTIIKHINDINGDMIQIEGCDDCTIIIMDYSAHVIIEKCNNCIIFIAPCKSS